jgi:hypothetical protein
MANQLRGSRPGSVQDATPQEKPSSGLLTMDYQAFRRKLAGLADPERKIEAAEKVEVKEAAIRLCSIFANLFGESLDRITLWEKIGSALRTSCAKVSDDDLDRFVTLCLEHIQAEDSKVAACAALMQMIETFAVRPSEWKYAFTAYINTHRTALLVHARSRWESVKKGTVEL